MNIVIRPPLGNLGCDWCDKGIYRICDSEESPAVVNPLHLIGPNLVKCSVPDMCAHESDMPEKAA